MAAYVFVVIIRCTPSQGQSMLSCIVQAFVAFEYRQVMGKLSHCMARDC